MSRSALLHLLPDLDADGAPPLKRQHQASFEPLVLRAAQVDSFEELGASLDQDNDPFSPPRSETPAQGFPAALEDDFASLSGLGGESDEDPFGLGPLDAELPPLDASNGADATLADLGLGDADLSQFAEAQDDAIGLAEIGGNQDNPQAHGSEPVADATEEALAAQEASHREEMERLEGWHQDAVDELLSVQIPKAKSEIVDAISAHIAPLLKLKLRPALVEEAVTALAGEIRSILADRDLLAFELSGPEAMLAAFDEQWEVDGVTVRKQVRDGIDLLARVDRTVLATRIGELDRLLEEALS